MDQKFGLSLVAVVIVLGDDADSVPKPATENGAHVATMVLCGNLGPIAFLVDREDHRRILPA
jgi:hypothetical protein